MASPRDLDPKFKTEKADVLPREDQNPEQRQGENEPQERQEQSTQADEDTPMLVHREKVMNPDGSIGEKVHGPMPAADWPQYEKENEL